LIVFKKATTKNQSIAIMKHINYLKLLFLLGIIILNSCEIYDSPKFSDEKMGTTQTFDIYSESVGQKYTIYTYLPPDYNPKTDSLPVMYMLDADYQFYTVANYAAKMIKLGEIEPVLIVGIGYRGHTEDQRFRDYTPAPVSDFDDEYAEAGGAENFHHFISNELIDKIEKKYCTKGNLNRAICGHSLGGLFAYYSFFKHPGTFTKFLAASPSVWWDDLICFQLEKDLSMDTTHFEIGTQLLVTMGKGGEGTGGVFPIYVDEIFENVKSRQYKNFNTEFIELSNPTHAENWQDAYQKALIYFYKK
jgi:uncharacterized protein